MSLKKISIYLKQKILPTELIRIKKGKPKDEKDNENQVFGNNNPCCANSVRKPQLGGRDA